MGKTFLLRLTFGLLWICGYGFAFANPPQPQLDHPVHHTEKKANGNKGESTPLISGLSQYDANAPVGFATLNASPTGGKGGRAITVSTAAALKSALKRKEPLIIYIKGVIETDNIISVMARDKTLLGLDGSALTNPNRTQGESGILYFKEGSNNLIIRNLTFRSAGAYDIDGRDNLCLDGCTNVWIDHCDFQDGVDGNFDCKNASDCIAVTWCRFRYFIEPKAGGSGGSDDHRFSNLWGNSDKHEADRGKLRTTFQWCWWDEGCRNRMPRVRFAQIHIVNCLYSSSVTSHCIGAGKESNIFVEQSDFSKLKRSKVYRLYSDDAHLLFTQCLTNLNPDDGVFTGRSFTPPYTLPSKVEAKDVRAIVTNHAGATLHITQE